MKAQENEARAHAIAAEGYRLVLSAAGVVTEYERYELRRSLVFHQGRCAELVADEPEQPQAPQPDWSEAPEWARWWAVDSTCDAYWYEDKPAAGNYLWGHRCGQRCCLNQFVALNGYDWTQTLQPRPANLDGCAPFQKYRKEAR